MVRFQGSIFDGTFCFKREGHFYCVYTIRFSEPTKVGSLKLDCVDRPYEYLSVPDFSSIQGVVPEPHADSIVFDT